MRHIWLRPLLEAICCATPVRVADDADTILVQQTDIGEGSRDLAPVVELRRLAEPHRGAQVHEKIDGKVGLLVEDANDELVEAQESFPIDVLGVVSTYVGSIVRELDTGALLPGPMLTSELSRNHAVGDELQVLEAS